MDATRTRVAGIRLRAVIAMMSVVVLLAAACGDDGDEAPGATTLAPTTAPSTTGSPTTLSPTSLSPTTSGPTTTVSPTPDCAEDDVLATVDAALERARLADGGDWSTDTTANAFAARTTTGDAYADRLALDCGLTASQSVGDDERLVIAAWTGPRVAFVVQVTDGPSTPYLRQSMFTVVIDATEGEYLDGDEQTLWAGTFDSGETFVIGHVDYVLGAAAKAWVGGPAPTFEEDITLDAERHAIAALGEARMRNIGIAEPPPPGSEEGFVQFVSPAGQVLVADVAPSGWFDPAVPRFFTGPTRFETIAGIEVRVTEPMEGDNLGFTRGAEFAWACDEFVWLLEPPFNGDADEMQTTVEAVIGTGECGVG